MSALSTDDLVRLRDAIERLTEAVGYAEDDAREAFRDAEHTGDRPDLHDTEVEVFADDLRVVLSELIRLRGEVEAMGAGLIEAQRGLQTVKEMSLRGSQRNTIMSACEKAQRKIDPLIPAAPTTGEKP